MMLIGQTIKARASLPLCAVLAALPAFAMAQQNHGDSSGSDSFGIAQQLTIANAPFREDINLVCTFTQECFEAESCSDTVFTPELSGIAGGLSATDMVMEASLISDAETTVLIGVKATDAYSLSGGSFDARHLLSIAPSGDARYTLHLADGPVAITYHGLCKGQN